MAEKNIATTTTSWIQRVGKSFSGILFGVVLLVASIVTLFINEGRFVRRMRALNEGRAAVVCVAATPIDIANEGKLVCFRGRANVCEQISDADFGVTVTNSLRLERHVEMFQWCETAITKSEKRLGGSEQRVTEYSYTTCWSEKPVNSSRFYNPDGHENPGGMPFESRRFIAKNVKVGDFLLTPSAVEKAGVVEKLRLEAAASSSSPFSVRDGFYYLPISTNSSERSPQVGDVRVGFTCASACDVSVLARQTGSTIASFSTKNGKLFDIRNGLLEPEEMFDDAQSVNKGITRFVRILGFVMTFCGFLAIFRPLSVIFDVLPMLGNIVGYGVAAISFLLALILSLATVAVAWLTYRPLIALPLLGGAALLAVVVCRKAKAGRDALVSS